jgi:hypothetical protein
MSSTEREERPPSDDPGQTLIVTVHDEDAGGAPITIESQPSDRVASVIQAMYSRLNAQPQEGDRLRCEETGADVFQYSGETLAAYAHQHCSELVWLFTAKTGGA